MGNSKTPQTDSLRATLARLDAMANIAAEMDRKVAEIDRKLGIVPYSDEVKQNDEVKVDEATSNYVRKTSVINASTMIRTCGAEVIIEALYSLPPETARRLIKAYDFTGLVEEHVCDLLGSAVVAHHPRAFAKNYRASVEHLDLVMSGLQHFVHFAAKQVQEEADCKKSLEDIIIPYTYKADYEPEEGKPDPAVRNYPVSPAGGPSHVRGETPQLVTPKEILTRFEGACKPDEIGKEAIARNLPVTHHGHSADSGARLTLPPYTIV